MRISAGCIALVALVLLAAVGLFAQSATQTVPAKKTTSATKSIGIVESPAHVYFRKAAATMKLKVEAQRGALFVALGDDAHCSFLAADNKLSDLLKIDLSAHEVLLKSLIPDDLCGSAALQAKFEYLTSVAQYVPLTEDLQMVDRCLAFHRTTIDKPIGNRTERENEMVTACKSHKLYIEHVDTAQDITVMENRLQLISVIPTGDIRQAKPLVVTSAI